jgi:arginine exporter protein ArgO
MMVLLGETWRSWADAPPFALGFVLQCALWFALLGALAARFQHERAGSCVCSFSDISPRPGALP